MDGSPASILVVCNPTDAAELCGAVAGEPLPWGPAEVSRADGGDDTIGRFAELRPEVVVVTASLDAGDARGLIAALRGTAPAGTFHVVLVGDMRGPVRNALDASEVGADRFIARPLSAKALRFAVSSGIAAARRGRETAAPPVSAAPEVVLPEPTATRISGAHRAVMIPGRRTTSPRMATESDRLDAMLDAAVDDVASAEVVRRTSGGFAIPIEAILAAGGEVELGASEVAVTAPISVHDVPTRPVTAFEARQHALAAAVDHAVTVEPASPPLLGQTLRGMPAPERRARTMPPPPPHAHDHPHIPEAPAEEVLAEEQIDDADILTAVAAPPAVGEESGSHELPPGLEAPVVSDTRGSFDDGGPEPAAWPSRGTEELPRDDEWEVPPMPMREPTMIISVGSPAPTGGPQLDLRERRPDGGWASSASVEPVEDGETDSGARIRAEVAARSSVPTLDDIDPMDPVEDDLDGELAGISASRPVTEPSDPPDPPDDAVETSAPPSGGDFARELRKKMSLMAQRLFRQGDAPSPPPVDVRPPHDFRTEIDLAEIDAGEALRGGTEVFDGDNTFAGDEHGLPTSPGILDGGNGTMAGHGGEPSARTSESGELARGSTDAPALIARMFLSEFTGKVTFRRPDCEKAIFFDGGRPVFASSDQSTDRMGELLYREGKITHEQYARCQDLVRESGRRMGEILVDKGFLKRRELLPAVRRHVEDIIYSLFAWDSGEYRVVPGDGAAGERIRLSRHPAAMVLEGVRRKLDLAALERLLGPPSTVVEVADREKAGTMIAVADLSTVERGALAGMDGGHDLGHIARVSGAGMTSTYQLAWAMTLLGVATVRRRGGDEDDAPALVGETDLVIDRERVRARHRLVSEADYFALLGVRRDATGFEIRRSYESARRDFDADAFPPELRLELALEISEISSVLDEAFRVLRDDRLRGDYLTNLAD